MVIKDTVINYYMATLKVINAEKVDIVFFKNYSFLEATLFIY